MAVFGIVLAAVVLVFSSRTSPAASGITWTPSAVNTTVQQGERTEIEVSFKATENLGNIALRIVPELDPFVDVIPSTFNNVSVGATLPVKIVVQPGVRLSPGLFEGALQVRARRIAPTVGPTIARPLPIAVLVLRAELAGTDADGNGVWDYVDRYIDATYSASPPTQQALRQYARALQGSLLNAGDPDTALRFYGENDLAAECIYARRPDDAYKVVSELKATLLNTKERSQAYILFSKQGAGKTFPVSDGGAAACNN